MKKISILLAVAILLGFGTHVSAQVATVWEARTAVNLADEYIERKIARDIGEANLVRRILRNGKTVGVHYTIWTASVGNGQTFQKVKKDFSGNGKIQGKELQEGKWTYILLRRTVWEKIYDECMPCGLSRSLGGVFIAEQHISTSPVGATQKNLYVSKANGLLNHKHIKVNGAEYTVITFETPNIVRKLSRMPINGSATGKMARLNLGKKLAKK